MSKHIVVSLNIPSIPKLNIKSKLANLASYSPIKVSLVTHTSEDEEALERVYAHLDNTPTQS